MQRLLLAMLLVVSACQSRESEEPPRQSPVVEHPLPDSFPVALTAYLADTARAGGYPRVLAGWTSTRSWFAVAAWHSHSDGYRENRLTIVEVLEDSVAARSQDVGMGDAHWDSVRVFSVDDDWFLVGAIEDEYALGLRVLKVDATGVITDTRLPDVALPDTSEFASGPSLSALEAARVSSKNGHLLVEFAQELVLDPGGREQSLLCPITAGSPVVFELAPSGWERFNASVHPIDVFSAVPTCASRKAR